MRCRFALESTRFAGASTCIAQLSGACGRYTHAADAVDELGRCTCTLSCRSTTSAAASRSAKDDVGEVDAPGVDVLDAIAEAPVDDTVAA